jgi:hypothetical protein
MTRRRSISFSAAAAGVAIAGLGLSLPFAPASSAASISSSLKSSASSPTNLLVHLRVTSHRSAQGASYKLLTADTSRAFTSAGVDSCGSGFVRTIINIPDNDGKYQEKTGFTGASPGAVGYTWSENIVLNHAGRPVDDYTVRQSGGLADRSSWTGQHTATTTDTPATFTVYVTGTWFLANGTSCFATGTVSGYVP